MKKLLCTLLASASLCVFGSGLPTFTGIVKGDGSGLTNLNPLSLPQSLPVGNTNAIIVTGLGANFVTWLNGVNGPATNLTAANGTYYVSNSLGFAYLPGTTFAIDLTVFVLSNAVFAEDLNNVTVLATVALPAANPAQPGSEVGSMTQGTADGNGASYPGCSISYRSNSANFFPAATSQEFFQYLRDALKPMASALLSSNLFSATSGTLKGYSLLSGGYPSVGTYTFVGDTYTAVPGCLDAMSVASLSNQVSRYMGLATNGFPFLYDSLLADSSLSGYPGSPPLTNLMCAGFLGYVQIVYDLWQASGKAPWVWGAFGGNVTNLLSTTNVINHLTFSYKQAQHPLDDDATMDAFYDGPDYFCLGSVFRWVALQQAAEMADSGYHPLDATAFRNESGLLKSNLVAILWDNTAGLFKAGTNASTHAHWHNIPANLMAARLGIGYGTNQAAILSNTVAFYGKGSWSDAWAQVYHYPTNEVTPYTGAISAPWSYPYLYWADEYGGCLELTRPDLAQAYWLQWATHFLTIGDTDPIVGGGVRSPNFFKPYAHIRWRAGDAAAFNCPK